MALSSRVIQSERDLTKHCSGHTGAELQDLRLESNRADSVARSVSGAKLHPFVDAVMKWCDPDDTPTVSSLVQVGERPHIFL